MQPVKNECVKYDISDKDNFDLTNLNFDELVPDSEVDTEDLKEFEHLVKEQKETQGMDILPYDLYRQILRSSLERRDFRAVFWITAMANFGVRYSDVASLKRLHLIDENNKIRQAVLRQEKKTKKQRQLFINDAVRMALLMHIWNGDFKPTDYLIVPKKGCGYKKEWYINDKGIKKAKKINGDFVYVLDEHGRKIPEPLSVDNAGRMMKKIITDGIGVAISNDPRFKGDKNAIGKICTHSLRKMYGKGIMDYYINNFNADVAYAHSAALSFLSLDYGHSSLGMTLHYSKDFEETKKEIVSNMNLGIEELTPFFYEERKKYLSQKGNE